MASTSATNDPAPTTPTVAAAILDLLKIEGVDRIFGIPGAANIESLIALKNDPDVTYHLCRQETGAAYIADGYARVSGRLGAVMITSGPGATNAVTGAMNAHASGTPLFVLTGEIKEVMFGRGYLQEGADSGLNVVDVYRASVGYSEMISNPGNAAEFFASAMRTSQAPHPGASHLSLPGDIAKEQMPAGFELPTSPSDYRAIGMFGDPGAVGDAVEHIARSERPLLMLGNSCRRALQDPELLSDLITAVERLSLPVVTGADGKGIFPESHELSLRNIGIAECCWPSHYFDSAAGHYDTLVTIGSALGQLATNTWEKSMVPSKTFIQIDEDPSVIGRDFPLTFGAVSTPEAALRDFVAAAKSVDVPHQQAAVRLELIEKIKSTVSPFIDEPERVKESDPITPQALMRIINEALPDGSQIMVDAGNCVGWCAHELVIDPPTQIHPSLAMGPMGFAVGAVIGAKLAEPDATCIAVVGDGAFLMQCGEVSTAAQYGVGAIWVVLADHDLTMVSQGMAAVTGDKSYEGRYEVGWSDLAAVAQGLGAQAYDVSSSYDVAAAVRDAIAGAANGIPQVIAVGIDKTQMPPYKYPPPPHSPQAAGATSSAGGAQRS